ncbi:dihydroorotase [Panacagrimonas perspica]|uniref:Dihydroorotase n=2 Tax=Panacagrimonas perspica TaxID=381431 RepID=A0A4V3F5T0_9GAMM|nr:dihydroorotase [Panacagrimonas perspica]TDU25686.1 dihydroorotase [Panacagrimonas perspica]
MSDRRPAPSLLFEGARVLDPASGFDGSAFVAVRDGRIEAVAATRPAGSFDQTIDARGQWLMPGIVDIAARFREPGASHKATFASETRAAQSAGITAVTIPPDTRPPIATPAMVDRIHGIADRVGGLDVHLLGALTQDLAGESLAEMSALRQAGCVGVSNAASGLRDSLVGRRALDYAHGLGLTVHVFAQNPALANRGCAHEGPIATRLGLAPIPVAAEVSAIRFWISLVEDTGAAVHFGRLSTARGVEMVGAAQKIGLPVSADVAAHQLFLTTDDIGSFNAMCHVLPPLRSAEDRDALRAGVMHGLIGTICSDHQPHEPDAKINPFPLTEPGISGLETLLPLGLVLVEDRILTPLQLAERLSLGPARVLGVAAGSMAVGQRANLVLVDPAQPFELRGDQMLSAGRNTPFLGRKLPGRASLTVHAGTIVHRIQAPR